MKNNTVYIAGKVTGLEYNEVFAKFKVKQVELEELGYQVVNPCELVSGDTPWDEAMRICIAALCECEFIYLLPCWPESDGAKVEQALAIKLGISTIEI